MTINTAINTFDDLFRNAYSAENKIEWLSRADSIIKRHVIDMHEGFDKVDFDGYARDADRETELLAPAPYDSMYLLFMEGQMHYYNGEYDKYNNAITNYNSVFDSYGAWYTRNHTPLSAGKRFLF